jgi:PAS domain S-box-containing protein
MSKKTSILVVDDVPVILQAYSEMLRAEGYEVWEASTGQQGLQAARERRPDLVLLDVVLPGLSGMEVCRQIKADAALTDVFVVLVSGEATDVDHKVVGLGTGADDYWVKPLDVNELLARVRTILRLRSTTAALRASEQRHRQLVEILPEAVGLIDLQGRFLAVNPQGVDMLGYANLGELLERSVFDVTRPEDHERIKADITSTLETGILRNAEYLLLRKSGEPFPVDVSAAVAAGADGQPSAVVLVARETTERKRAEEQIRLLADAVQSSQDMICITDQENRFTFANRAFLQTYGYATEEIMGRTPDFLCSAKNPPGLTDRIFQQTLRGGWKGQIVDCRKDGTEFPVSIDTSPIKSSDGRTLGLIAVARDISERIRAERRSVAFSQLGYRLSAASTREDAAHMIMDIASDLFGWDAGYVHLYSERDDHLIPLLTVDTVDGQRMPIRPAGFTLDPSSLMRMIMKEGARLINRDNNTPLGLHLVPFGVTTRCSASMMYAPIHSGSIVTGILSVQSYTPRAYSQEDLELLQTLADHCGEALQRIEIADLLRQAEAKYRSIVENATEGIFQTSPDGRHLSANPALARMLGYATPDDLISSVTDIGRQIYVVPERRREFKRLIEKDGFVRDFEAELYRKDGSKFWVSINCRVVRDASGAVLYYEGTNQDISERKRGEHRLRTLSRAVEQSPARIVITDASGEIEYVNAKFSQMTGYSLDEVRGQNPRILKSGEIPQEEFARLWQAISSGREWHGEFHNRRKNGELFWEVASVSPILDEAGRTTHFVSVAEDITERKWVENLIQLQRDFGTFLSSTGDLGAAAERLLKIALENEDLDCGAVFLVNSETNALELTAHQGLSAGYAKRASRFAAAPVRDRLAGARQATFREQRGPMAGIVQQLKREGLLALEAIPIQHSGQVVAVLNVGSHGHATIAANTRQTIDALAAQAGGAIARIRAEQLMRSSQQLLEKTFHSIRAAVLVVDADTHTIQECNPGATHIFGYARKELVGRSSAFLHLDEAMPDQFGSHLDAAIRGKGLVSDFESTMRRKDGTSFPTEHSVAPIHNEAGRIVTWVVVIRNISERKRTEAGLRQLSQRIIEAQEAERQRVARELHDSVNQVIASAKMRLRRVEDGGALNPAAREILARCDELLVEALEENRRIAHNLRPSDLDALGLADACRNLCREFQERTNLVVKTCVARSAHRCPPATELNLYRIVQEALNNVAKHAHARTVQLRLAIAGDSILLRVKDDGCGFDPATSKAPKRGKEGIGLTNMRERAVILGGTCEVESIPNQGTSVTVRVPCHDH